MVYPVPMREGLEASASTKDAYHHGDLAEALMRLAITHIEEEGTEKLSLRALAREAGVSQSAPYRHFPTKRCLLAGLATQGFQILHDSIEQVVETDTSIEERFIAMGVAYVHFALTHPTHYHLMFGSVLGDFSDYEMLHTAASRSFAQVTRVQHELVIAKNLDVDEKRFAGVIWAGVHGIASLLTNMHGRSGKGQSEAMESIRTVSEDLEDSVRMMFDHLVR